jgi:hypothetical protein
MAVFIEQFPANQHFILIRSRSISVTFTSVQLIYTTSDWIIGKTSPSARFDQVFTSLNFPTIFFFLQSKVISLASNSQSGGQGPCIYVPQWQVRLDKPSDTGFPFRRLLRPTELRWMYSNQPPHEDIYLTSNITLHSLWNLGLTSPWIKVMNSFNISSVKHKAIPVTARRDL